ncbi:superoxide dismutase [Candidatus Paracaedibacter symbiosus]|uniref:superoxide dismutase n=1 Tax=Candidatus Paracaedibacter symbiosus TaxID=244582 RepID=UPI0009FD52DF|nr:superoxide dismutase [Candidatus Paracaedibacter symbiosus]
MFIKNLFPAFILFGGFALLAKAETASKIELPALPYEMDSLAPYISEKTLEFHYRKHHQTYVDNLNTLIEAKKLQGKSLEELILLGANDPKLIPVFNNAAQTWNHTFYWNSMKKNGGGQPTGALLDKIKKDFGSYEKFKDAFVDAGTKVFGSGWVWLILEGDTLKIVTTSNADLPLTSGKKALLTCDVWEHAYYLDYQNRRKSYVEVFLNHLVNWSFAAANMKS